MKEMDPMVCMRNVVPRIPDLRFTSPLDWEIRKDEQWAIIGPNGGGKTLIADLLQHKYALKEGNILYAADIPALGGIKSIAFKDIYSLADYRNAYYQQRWHSTETDEMPLVKELLQATEDDQYLDSLLKLFHVEELLGKRIIFLSSGELRKFLIIRALLSRPRILILDNPFIGLDAVSRDLLVEMLKDITTLENIQIILLLSNPQDIPSIITHVLPVRDRKWYSPFTKDEFLKDKEFQEHLFPEQEIDVVFPVSDKEVTAHQITIGMENIMIRYGKRIILKDLNWEVKNGDKWALFGPNGSGKSTLLSLVYADNPQSYANTFYLFDRKRGSGESIWDIKKRIGYVSPEMHLYYMENVPALKIVGSGYFDSVGLHRKCNPEQEEGAVAWMRIFGIGHLKDRLFFSLSSGEQRLVLLARAFVKDPDLLVLDEPLHGLDISNKHRVISIIEKFCTQPGKTLICVTHYPHELPACVDKCLELIKHH